VGGRDGLGGSRTPYSWLLAGCKNFCFAKVNAFCLLHAKRQAMKVSVAGLWKWKMRGCGKWEMGTGKWAMGCQGKN